MLLRYPLLSMFVACAPTRPEIPDLHATELTVEPGNLNLQTSSRGADPVQFVAKARFDDGSSEELEQAEWEVSNRSSGTIDATGLFTPSSTNGGVTWVTARFDGLEASAELHLTYQDEMNESGVDTSLFDAPKVNQPGMWTYPQDGVNLPRNTPSIVFQWADPGAQAARLRFRSEVTDLTVYTTGSSWTASEAIWPLIVASNAGASVQVELSLAVNGQVWADSVRTFQVNRMDANGSVFYWSTSTSGIMEIPYGGSASEYLTATTTGHCVGCHTVSNGLIAFTYDGGDGYLGVKRVADRSDVVPYSAGYGNFKTFSPDGNYVLSTYQGSLLLWDAHTGAFLYEIPTGLKLTHPDWSPLGDKIVAVNPANYACDWCSSEGNLVLIDYYGDGQFGSPALLYDAPPGYNAYYPAFSPDGEWIAFNQSTGDSYDDVDAGVWVVPTVGGTPIVLSAANLGDGLTNSIPRWGPLPDDDVLWLAFSSKRIYGNNLTTGNPQIWVAGFDPIKAGKGEDPSWPAFWLPGQDAAQGNHIPAWAER